MSKHVTPVEIDDPPGYFRMARTGRVHLVRSVTRVMQGNGAAHQMVMFACTNMANARQGALLTEMPCLIVLSDFSPTFMPLIWQPSQVSEHARSGYHDLSR